MLLVSGRATPRYGLQRLSPNPCTVIGERRRHVARELEPPRSPQPKKVRSPPVRSPPQRSPEQAKKQLVLTRPRSAPVQRKVASPAKAQAAGAARAAQEQELTQALLEKLRAALTLSGPDAIRSLARHFRGCDAGNSGRLDLARFSDCLKYSNCPFDLGTPAVEMLHRHFDRDGSGAICYDELLQSLRSRLPPARQRLATQAFDALDASGNGSVPVSHAAAHFSGAKHPGVLAGCIGAEEAAREFFGGFDGRDRVTQREWMANYEDVSAAVGASSSASQPPAPAHPPPTSLPPTRRPERRHLLPPARRDVVAAQEHEVGSGN